MKLKKILAVALAATTALSMMPANVAEAKSSIKITANDTQTYLDSGDTFTATIYERLVDKPTADDRIVATFTVDDAVYNYGKLDDLNPDKDKTNASRDNMKYDHALAKGEVATTGGTVKITALSVGGNVGKEDLIDGSISVTLPTKVYTQNTAAVETLKKMVIKPW